MLIPRSISSAVAIRTLAGLLAIGTLLLILGASPSPAAASTKNKATKTVKAKASSSRKARACAARIATRRKNKSKKYSTRLSTQRRVSQCTRRRTPKRPRPASTATPTTPSAPSVPATPSDDQTAGSSLGWNGFGVKNWPGANWRPYSADSPFNQPVANATVHPRSAEIVQRIFSWGQPGNLLAGTSGTTSDFGHPTYYSQPDDPIFTLHATSSKTEIEGMKIAVPDAAQPALGSDGHMTVVTRDGWEYDLWRVQSKPKGGGTLTFSIGHRTRIDGKGIGAGGTAANFGNLAGVIRAQELAAGQINHALFVVVKCVSNNTSFGNGAVPGPSSSQGSWVYPANHGAAPCSAAEQADAPPTGARFQLAMSDAEIDALAVPAWKKTILRALATYGAYIGDTGGSGGFSLQFESGSTYTSFGVSDPLVAYSKSTGIAEGTGSWAGAFSYKLTGGVDWQSRLRVITPPSVS